MERFQVTEDKNGCILNFIMGYLLASYGLWKSAKIILEEGSLTGGDIVAIIFLLLLLLLGGFMIVTMNDFCVTVSGDHIHVKRTRKLQFEMEATEITKIVCHERVGRRGQRALFVDIRSGEKQVTVSSYNTGFLAMLEYLQRRYDNGTIPEKAMKKLNYNKLLDFKERCSKNIAARRKAKKE